MPRTAYATAVPRHAPPTPALPSQSPGAADLAWRDLAEDEDHIVVLGGLGSELMCALLRAGATKVTHLRAHERPEADSASMVVVPRVPSLDWLAAMLPSIRRALTDRGRVVVLVGSDFVARTRIRRMLAPRGLTEVRARTPGEALVFRADRSIRRFA